MTNLELADKLQDAASSHYGDLCGMLWDAGAALRNLHTENTALRVTEDNLRQELQECQDQRRAAFRRIEELERQLEEARKDAERYRWLRDLDEDPVLSLAAQYTDMNGSAKSIRQRIDAAIDASMQKGQS